MIRAWMNNHSFQRRSTRGLLRRMAAAFVIGTIAVAGSLARSFEPTEQDQAKQSAQLEQDKTKAATGKVKPAGDPSAKHSSGGSTAAGAGRAKLQLPERPLRTVTPPTLTSADLDRLITQHLTKNDPKVEPATPTTDIEFVRRIYFDVIGRPPTPDQVQSFLFDRSKKDKRARLIDTLLNTPEYGRNWAKYWRDVVMFHSTNENRNQVGVDALEDWLAKQFQANTPWDEITSGLITATGRNDQNGAVALSLAHESRPVEMAGEVSRIFLGVQIQCAQCHDHKTDSWKRLQFHEFAAFFSGVLSKRVEPPANGQPGVFAVLVQGPRRYLMPDKDNPAKQVPVAPRFFLSSSKSKPEPALPLAVDIPERRAVAAAYVTGQDNPWFAKAFINRIWYALMGETFYEPIDDIGPERTPKGGEVLEPLATQWQRGGYDIRWLMRTILNTEAYQRRVRSSANAAGKTPFASSCPSRLRADQVFDALVQALALPLDSTGNLPLNPNAGKGGPGPAGKRGPGQAGNALKAQARLLSLGDPRRPQNQPQTKGGARKAAEAIGLGSQVGKNAAALRRPNGPRLLVDRLFGIDPSIANEDVVGTIPQALFLMNSPMVASRIQARPGTVLGQIMSNAPNEHAALAALYLRVLSRQPTKQELEICGKYFSSVNNHIEAFEDIYWSLINSTEFLTRR